MFDFNFYTQYVYLVKRGIKDHPFCNLKGIHKTVKYSVLSTLCHVVSVSATRIRTQESIKYQLIALFLQHNVYIY